MPSRAHVLLSGQVQGIGFRYFAHTHGRALGLTGFARNLVDGTVEVEAQGSKEAIEQFIEKIRIGPVGAAVDTIEISWIEPVAQENGFGNI